MGGGGVAYCSAPLSSPSHLALRRSHGYATASSGGSDGCILAALTIGTAGLADDSGILAGFTGRTGRLTIRARVLADCAVFALIGTVDEFSGIAHIAVIDVVVVILGRFRGELSGGTILR